MIYERGLLFVAIDAIRMYRRGEVTSPDRIDEQAHTLKLL